MASTMPSESVVAREVTREFRGVLPQGWKVNEVERRNGTGDRRLLDLVAPDGRSAKIRMFVFRSFGPQEAKRWATTAAIPATDEVPLVVAAYLSPATRAQLDAFGASYADTTGSIQLTVSDPAVFLARTGADTDPWREPTRLGSLRGRRAGRAVRAIIDSKPPFGIRELAQRAGVSAPTISRVVDLLSVDGAIERAPQGGVEAVDWQRVIERWVVDYSQLGSNRPHRYVQPRGVNSLVSQLQGSDLRYAATGSFAARWFNPIAASPSAAIYTDDVAALADSVGLYEAEGAFNTLLLEPFDDVVFDRMAMRDGVWCVGPSQLAADLLSGPGREPSQGVEMLKWMKANLDEWRN